jgi:steroid 5-alpha reductase family enzyme
MPNLLLPPNRVLTERLTTNVYPNFGGVGGADQLSSVIGALLTLVLVVAVLMLVVCAITWALANSHGNYQTAGRARTGLWVAVGTAALAGAGVTWANFLLHLGNTL